jgi:dienelactone hydrolase
MMLLVDGDTITNESACLALAARMQAAGRPVATQVFPGVTHGFDQAEKAPLSTLGHDPAATREALRIGLAFLNDAAGR